MPVKTLNKPAAKPSKTHKKFKNPSTAINVE
jgi:hypothetical protein